MEQEKTQKGEELLESIVEKVVNAALGEISKKDRPIAQSIPAYQPDESLMLVNLGLDLFRVLVNVYIPPGKPEDYPRLTAARAQVSELAKSLL